MSSVLFRHLLRRVCAVGLYVFVVRSDATVTVRGGRLRRWRPPAGAAVLHVEGGLTHGAVSGVSTRVFWFWWLWLTNARVVRRLRSGDQRNSACNHHAIPAGQPAQEQ